MKRQKEEWEAFSHKPKFVDVSVITHYVKAMKGRDKVGGHPEAFNTYVGGWAVFKGELSGSDEDRTKLHLGDFSRVDFSHSTLSYCTLGQFCNAYLTGVTLNHVEAARADFSGTTLDNGTVLHSNLHGANFRQAKFRYGRVVDSSICHIENFGLQLEGTALDRTREKCPEGQIARIWLESTPHIQPLEAMQDPEILQAAAQYAEKVLRQQRFYQLVATFKHECQANRLVANDRLSDIVSLVTDKMDQYEQEQLIESIIALIIDVQRLESDHERSPHYIHEEKTADTLSRELGKIESTFTDDYLKLIELCKKVNKPGFNHYQQDKVEVLSFLDRVTQEPHPDINIVLAFWKHVRDWNDAVIKKYKYDDGDVEKALKQARERLERIDKVGAIYTNLIFAKRDQQMGDIDHYEMAKDKLGTALFLLAKVQKSVENQANQNSRIIQLWVPIVLKALHQLCNQWLTSCQDNVAQRQLIDDLYTSTHIKMINHWHQYVIGFSIQAGESYAYHQDYHQAVIYYTQSVSYRNAISFDDMDSLSVDQLQKTRNALSRHLEQNRLCFILEQQIKVLQSFPKELSNNLPTISGLLQLFIKTSFYLLDSDPITLGLFEQIRSIYKKNESIIISYFTAVRSKSIILPDDNQIFTDVYQVILLLSQNKYFLSNILLTNLAKTASKLGSFLAEHPKLVDKLENAIGKLNDIMNFEHSGTQKNKQTISIKISKDVGRVADFSETQPYHWQKAANLHQQSLDTASQILTQPSGNPLTHQSPPKRLNSATATVQKANQVYQAGYRYYLIKGIPEGGLEEYKGNQEVLVVRKGSSYEIHYPKASSEYACVLIQDNESKAHKELIETLATINPGEILNQHSIEQIDNILAAKGDYTQPKNIKRFISDIIQGCIKHLGEPPRPIAILASGKVREMGLYPGAVFPIILLTEDDDEANSYHTTLIALIQARLERVGHIAIELGATGIPCYTPEGYIEENKHALSSVGPHWLGHQAIILYDTKSGSHPSPGARYQQLQQKALANLDTRQHSQAFLADCLSHFEQPFKQIKSNLEIIALTQQFISTEQTQLASHTEEKVHDMDAGLAQSASSTSIENRCSYYLMSRLSDAYGCYLISALPDDLSKFKQNKNILIIKNNGSYSIYCVLVETGEYNTHKPIVIDEDEKSTGVLKALLDSINPSDKNLCESQTALMQAVDALVVSNSGHTLSDDLREHGKNRDVLIVRGKDDSYKIYYVRQEALIKVSPKTTKLTMNEMGQSLDQQEEKLYSGDTMEDGLSKTVLKACQETRRYLKDPIVIERHVDREAKELKNVLDEMYHSGRFSNKPALCQDKHLIELANKLMRRNDGYTHKTLSVAQGYSQFKQQGIQPQQAHDIQLMSRDPTEEEREDIKLNGVILIIRHPMSHQINFKAVSIKEQPKKFLYQVGFIDQDDHYQQKIIHEDQFPDLVKRLDVVKSSDHIYVRDNLRAPIEQAIKLLQYQILAPVIERLPVAPEMLTGQPYTAATIKLKEKIAQIDIEQCCLLPLLRLCQSLGFEHELMGDDPLTILSKLIEGHADTNDIDGLKLHPDFLKDIQVALVFLIQQHGEQHQALLRQYGIGYRWLDKIPHTFSAANDEKQDHEDVSPHIIHNLSKNERLLIDIIDHVLLPAYETLEHYLAGYTLNLMCAKPETQQEKQSIALYQEKDAYYAMVTNSEGVSEIYPLSKFPDAHTYKVADFPWSSDTNKNNPQFPERMAFITWITSHCAHTRWGDEVFFPDYDPSMRPIEQRLEQIIHEIWPRHHKIKINSVSDQLERQHKALAQGIARKAVMRGHLNHYCIQAADTFGQDYRKLRENGVENAVAYFDHYIAQQFQQAIDAIHHRRFHKDKSALVEAHLKIYHKLDQPLRAIYRDQLIFMRQQTNDPFTQDGLSHIQNILLRYPDPDGTIPLYPDLGMKSVDRPHELPKYNLYLLLDDKLTGPSSSPQCIILKKTQAAQYQVEFVDDKTGNIRQVLLDSQQYPKVYVDVHDYLQQNEAQFKSKQQLLRRVQASQALFNTIDELITFIDHPLYTWHQQLYRMIEKNRPADKVFNVAWIDPVTLKKVSGYLKPNICNQLITPESDQYTFNADYSPKCQRDKNRIESKDSEEEKSDRIVIPIAFDATKPLDSSIQADGYCKAYPELPAVQHHEQIITLAISGVICPAILCRFKPQNGPAYPVLISKALPEKSLFDQMVKHDQQGKEEIINKGDIATIESKLDPFYFTLKYLETLLIRSEDIKFENIGVETVIDHNGQPAQRLVDIDADHSFVELFTQQARERIRLNVKTIVYALLSMDARMDPHARALFLSLDLKTIITHSLLKLERYEQTHIHEDGLFTPAEVKDIYDKHKSYIGSCLDQDIMCDFSYRWHLIRDKLKKYPLMSPQRFLKKVEPLLSQFYPDIDRSQTALERYQAAMRQSNYIEALSGKAFIGRFTSSRNPIQQIVQASEHYQKVQVPLVKRMVYYFDKEAKKAKRIVQEGRLPTPYETLEAIQTFHGLIENSQQTIEKIYNGDNRIFHKIHTPEILLSSMRMKDMQAHIAQGYAHRQLTSAEKSRQIESQFKQQQQQILDVILLAKFQHCRTLNLSGFTSLKDSQLQTILEHCIELTNLDISGCVQLTDDAIEIIENNCPRIQSLNISGLPQLKKITLSFRAQHYPFSSKVALSFLHLETLIVKHCPALKEINIDAPQLSKFEHEGADKLCRVHLGSQTQALAQLEIILDHKILLQTIADRFALFSQDDRKLILNILLDIIQHPSEWTGFRIDYNDMQLISLFARVNSAQFAKSINILLKKAQKHLRYKYISILNQFAEVMAEEQRLDFVRLLVTYIKRGEEVNHSSEILVQRLAWFTDTQKIEVFKSLVKKIRPQSEVHSNGDPVVDILSVFLIRYLNNDELDSLLVGLKAVSVGLIKDEYEQLAQLFGSGMLII